MVVLRWVGLGVAFWGLLLGLLGCVGGGMAWAERDEPTMRAGFVVIAVAFALDALAFGLVGLSHL